MSYVLAIVPFGKLAAHAEVHTRASKRRAPRILRLAIRAVIGAALLVTRAAVALEFTLLTRRRGL